MLWKGIVVSLTSLVWCDEKSSCAGQESTSCKQRNELQALDAGQSLIQRLSHRGQMDLNRPFSSFVAEYNRDYEEGGLEYAMRQSLYDQRIAAVLEHNNKDLPWKQSINEFMDWTEDELRNLRGYRKHKRSAASVRLLETQVVKVAQSGNSSSEACAARSASCGQQGLTNAACCSNMVCGFEGTCVDPSEVPESKVWTKDEMESADTVENQGSCGSCWAVAAAMVIQLHADKHAKAHGKQSKLISPQAMLGCTPNPNECGGTGGCDGATPELAYEWARDNWLSSLDDEEYKGSNTCPDKASKPAASIGGHVLLPLNKETPVLQALVDVGPLSVAVAAGSWYFYSSGISKCTDLTVDHAVTLMGFGKDYWKVKNSWGLSWGEKGHIRLQRYPGNEPCGTDHNMQVGIGCKDDPREAKVCGECGILSDVAYPIRTVAL